jgi:predicted kinase
MAAVHLIEGPVGAGKSTFAAKVAREVSGVHLPLDEWFVHLFSPDRPATDFVYWYQEKKCRLLDLIWKHSIALLSSGTSPVLELGLVRRADREAIYARAEEAGVKLVIYVLDAPRDVRRERVRRRNSERGATFFMVVPDTIFELASDAWEPPDDEEIHERRIQTVASDQPGDG